MTTDVTRVQGTYKIQNVNNAGVVTDVLIVDSTGTSHPYSSVPTSSTVVITGDLIVVGTRTQTSSTEVTIKDPTIVLNQGNGWLPGQNSLAGIKISGDVQDLDINSHFLQWNNNETWQATGPLGLVNGIYEFRRGLPGNTVYSGIKINAIRMPKYDIGTESQPEGPYSTISGFEVPRLNIFGSDNPTSVMSVSGTSNYELNCTDDDDIPNVRFVLDQLASNIDQARSVVVGQSYITINDKVEDQSSFSQIIGVLDGTPTVKPNPTTGTVVLRITTSTAQIAQMQFNANQISPVGANRSLVISANGTGQIIAASPILFQTSTPPVPGTGQTGLYSQNPGSGGTGMYYVNSSTGGVITQDEFVSRKKALIFSLIF